MEQNHELPNVPEEVATSDDGRPLQPLEGDANVLRTADSSRHSDDHDLGELIQQERVALGLSAEEAARRAKLAYKTWLRIESGDPVRNMSLTGVDRLFGLPSGTTVRASSELNGHHKLINEIRKASNTAPAKKPSDDSFAEWINGLRVGDLKRLQSMEASGAEEELNRLRRLLRDIHDSLQPYMDVLDATQTGLDEIRISTEVLARISDLHDLPAPVTEAIHAVRSSVDKYAEITLDKKAWLELSRELVRIGTELESEVGDGER